jgi:transposase
METRLNTSTQYSHFIGVDISKYSLDIHILPNNKILKLPYTNQGMEILIAEIKRLGKDVIVGFESTGGYERQLLYVLSANNISFVLIKPTNIRNFAKAQGYLAKTDKIDSKIIADYLCKLKPKLQEYINKNHDKIRELVVRKLQLTKELSIEKTRLTQNNDIEVKESILRHIKYLKDEIKIIESKIDEMITSNEKLSQTSRILESFKGCGKQTSQLLVGLLPEIGRINTKQIASLCGLAPMNNDSGSYVGRRVICGGRKYVRNALYMAIISSIRYNPVIRSKYEYLIKKGKPKKVALVACMRKMIITLNAMVRDNSLFEPNKSFCCS